MDNAQNLFIMITPEQLRGIIQQAVKEALQAENLNYIPEFSTAEAFASLIKTSQNKCISPITIRKWHILKPAKREINGKIFFNTRQALAAIDAQK